MEREPSSQSLQSFRERLQNAESVEELAETTRELLQAFPGRYRLLREYLEEGNEDIEERLAFLQSEVSGDFLDVGSYDGFFVLELEKEGHRAVGIDMMSEAISVSLEEQKLYPSSKAEFREAYAEELPFEDDSFDTTILSHTLEHVFDPAVATAEAVRATKSGGKLVVVVPTELGNDPTHLRVVEPEWLEQELTKYGAISDQLSVGDGIAYICNVR